MNAYHLVPAGVSKGRAVARHMRVRGLAPEECIAVGDSREDLTVAEHVGTFWLVANALGPRPAARRRAAAQRPRRRGRPRPGVYEAVVTELAERR
jgi:phosphoserine phosphatase